ncbi:sorbosone dehydrogenase family protein [Flavobacterium sp. GT3R68]|uniref:PQQ-dependent sugar dehydrogenase n=1 Tax=Flavobacterium sp. GT3R68 TaxID=2594437 RepID=UPI000F88B7A1|nr:sorbosone dehydrogenase family protein [Flavobacterium sp. GT3R68]RTY96028.1 sorbosone dehydrogenase family protein [Flavobacterium sp. GSN2]TRW93801.1 sorbosone dehydrogenase family protein [Flavobacterium sp. GT3R68]
MKRHLLFMLILPLICFAQNTLKTTTLPPPSKATGNYSKVIGWKGGQTPIAPSGFVVSKYADGFKNPRWICITPNGDVLVVQSNSNYSWLKRIGASLIGAGRSNNLKPSANVITLLRDSNKDGAPDQRETFLTDGLNQPFGMLVIGNWFYVANTNALIRYPYQPGQTKIIGKGEKIADLPAGKHNQHWTRNIITNADKSKIYISIGSGSNIAEHGIANELSRACILELNPDGTELRVFASGLRNPVGMDWAPGSKTLWTVVNERDGLGENLVPDYLTSVKENGFYGWPYVYFGNHIDVRVKEMKPDLVEKTLVPDLALGSHTASLGLAFYTGTAFPEKYRNGAFIAQHGSWNRKILSGYRVVFVPFKDGKPSGDYEDFLTGFIIDPNKDKVHGRPTGVFVHPDGSLLLTDDKTNTVWRIAAK